MNSDKKPRLRKLGMWVLLLPVVAVPWGCGGGIGFPAEPLQVASSDGGVYRAYDTTGDGRADFFLCARRDGLVDRIAYDRDADGRPDETVTLNHVPFTSSRHLVLILDGVDHDVMSGYYDAGGLRMFNRPSRVVAPYPTLTDLAMEDVLGYLPCRGLEAKYFDRLANRIVGGTMAYLGGKNQPYNRLLHYRADTILDGVGYVHPWPIFCKETDDAKRLFDKAKTQEMLAYFVSSAGMGTQHGAAGQQRCLRRIERMVLQVLHETRGLTKITLLADHGHSYVPSGRIDIEGHLRRKGWRLSRRIHGERDVVFVRFGLVTYASFATRRPKDLAVDLAELEGVELASFADGGAVVVIGPGGGRAVIRRRDGGHSYTDVRGDPLSLKKILAAGKPDAEGFHDPDWLLAATISHRWPAPLQRLWRAHFGLVENPPDVIVSLADGFFTGVKGFAGSVKVASTHGGLNRRNSVTFIMSTAGPLPPVMRSGDIPKNMQKLTGQPFPLSK